VASIARDPGGRKRILFVGPDGKRKPIRLGKMTMRAAEIVKRHVENLLAANDSRTSLEPDTACWLADIPDDLADKLARAGLPIPKRQTAIPGAFLAEYINGRTDVKPRSV